jgi:TRAP-type mannitol/chloroaromatic compound transport system substrate-binding protein
MIMPAGRLDEPRHARGANCARAGDPRHRRGEKTMNRRRFIAGASVIAATPAFPAPAIGQGVRELKMVTTWPKTLPGLQSSAVRVAKAITDLSGGKLQVKVFGAGELVAAFESFNAVSSGLADMYHSSEITWYDKSPGFSYFCNVPFGLTATETNAWVRVGGGQALWDELSAGFGLKSFLTGNTGAQMGGWFTKEITSVEAFKGLRYRMPGPGGEVLRRMGAVVVNLPAGEIIPALRSGAIDASEFAGPWIDMALGLHKAARYYYYPGFHEPGAALSLSINKKLWDGLGSAERAVIEAATGAENDYSLSEVVFNNAVSMETLAKDPAIELMKLDDTILQALGKSSGEVLAEMQRDDITKRIYQSWMKFRASVLRWSDISERSFMNARALKYPF